MADETRDALYAHPGDIAANDAVRGAV